MSSKPWPIQCEVIGRPELGNDSRFATGQNRMQHADFIDSLLEKTFPTRCTAEWVTLLTELKYPAVAVPTMQALLQQPVHRQRNAFVPVIRGNACFEAPILPQRLDEAGPLHGGIAPELGSDSDHYRKELSQGTALRLLHQAPAEKLPLEGVRIIDLTMGWAGPFASRMMADLGAEVIKVESITYPDWWRGVNFTEEFYRDRLYEKSTHFNLMNRNKLGITLDLTQEEGKRLLKELVQNADAVIENYSAEVLPKLGLEYANLSERNPKLVMLSMPAFGLGNDWSDTRAYGGTLEQASGLPIYTGHADGPPAMTSYAYGDPIGGFNASAALLLGLLKQRATGRGRHINLSQVEGMLPLTAPYLIEQSVFGSVSERCGNRHPVNAPHGCYPCEGNDAWIVISIQSDIQWNALCKVLGRTDWEQDTQLACPAGRRKKHAMLDAGIAMWTKCRDNQTAMQLLQQAGVAAGAVCTIAQVLDDPHLHARGFWRDVERAHVGSYVSSTPVFRPYRDAGAQLRASPTLGQNTNEVLRRLLDLSEEQLRSLEERGVVGTRAKPKVARQVQKSVWLN